MAAITFDTLGYSKTLQAAGMPREQADAFAKAQKDATEQLVEIKELATKGDLLRLQMQLEAKSSNDKQDLLRWILGIALAQVALTVTLITLLK